MTTAAATTGEGIDRIGTVSIAVERLGAPRRTSPRIPPLVLTVPPHTALSGPEASAAWIAPHLHRYVLMFLPLEVGPHDYTVQVAIDARGAGRATITEVLHGAARVARQPRDLGLAVLTPAAPAVAEIAATARRRR